jgi:uncharacterized Rmd1/YagE family protein
MATGIPSPGTLRRPAPTNKRVVLKNPHLDTQPIMRTLPGHEDGTSQQHNTSPQSYPVHAFHVAQSIDLPKVISNVLSTRSVRKMMERLSVVVQLQPLEENGHAPRFVAVFRFGSVVFFNVSPRDVADLLWDIKQCATTPVLSGNEHKEKFCVHVQPGLYDANGPTPMQDVSSSSAAAAAHVEESNAAAHGPPDLQDVVTGDYCLVQELNMKAVDVISNVMAQSVALDSYNDTVDSLLQEFEQINKAVVMKDTNRNWFGNLMAPKQQNQPILDRDKLFRAVALNNAIFIEMVSKVGIKDRIDTAWNLSQYEDISQGLIEEFDIEQRFEHIEFKLNLIQQNAKFFLEVLSNQKSNSLEWIIIVLIMFECVLMCMEMSGVGEPFFNYFGIGGGSGGNIAADSSETVNGSIDNNKSAA